PHHLSFSSQHTAPPPLYPLSLHDALPILPTLPSTFSPPVVYQTVPLFCQARPVATVSLPVIPCGVPGPKLATVWVAREVSFQPEDRKSTRLNSSHDQISYAVFCLKKKTK